MERRMHRSAVLGVSAALLLSLVGGSSALAETSTQGASSAAVAESQAAPGITWTLHRNPEPSPDEVDAYNRIEAAVSAAVTRYGRFSDAAKHLNVYYAPGVPTAEANYNGDVRFGTDRGFMNERTALHEISHTLGIGQTSAFFDRCAAGDWPNATDLLRQWDGPDAVLNCGGGHIWPYGLNYDSEWSELAADRHTQLIEAMLTDGM